MAELFDDWSEKYNAWFQTPIGALVREYEGRLIAEMLAPAPGERILDAGCGTGLFTADFLAAGARVTGLELSLPMLAGAARGLAGPAFWPVAGDMLRLPFADGCFDKVVSITALEFVAAGEKAMAELFRVARPGGRVVVATLNSLSPWAERRREAGRRGHHLFKQVYFRSPTDLAALAPGPGRLATAIHFLKEDHPELAREKEETGRRQKARTGAFVAGLWQKG